MRQENQRVDAAMSEFLHQAFAKLAESGAAIENK
jgi:hypothetical protein